jgi:enhancing lycopene biosynthesis protein 2
MVQKRFAVILAGCGVYDGSEIHEAVSTLLAIDKLGMSYQCFAPDIIQHHVINHLTGQVEKETRNVLIESARIARGNVKRINLFDPDDFDALIIPGGFGVAKNLCSFAFDGADCLVNTETGNAILSAYHSGLPIGALCISPAIVAKVLEKGLLTIGNDSSTAKAIEKMGATHQISSGDDIVLDKKNKLVTSPCYMLDSPISLIASGAEKVIRALLKLM